MKTIDYLTGIQLIDLEKSGHALHVYPRLHIVSVDGYKKYKVSPAAIAKFNYWKKTGIAI